MRLLFFGLAAGGCGSAVLAMGAALQRYRRKLAADARAREFLRYWHDREREPRG
jgi:hypothetical protein